MANDQISKQDSSSERSLGVILGQAIRFGIVGLANTAITLAIIYGMTAIGVSYIISNGIGYVVGFVNSFFMNRVWTFQSKGQVSRQMLMFLVIFGISYLFQLMALLIQTDWLSIPVWLAQLFSMGVYTAINFVLNKIVTFRTN